MNRFAPQLGPKDTHSIQNCNASMHYSIQNCNASMRSPPEYGSAASSRLKVEATSVAIAHNLFTVTQLDSVVLNCDLVGKLSIRDKLF
jgi:hypothetical protein